MWPGQSTVEGRDVGLRLELDTRDRGSERQQVTLSLLVMGAYSLPYKIRHVLRSEPGSTAANKFATQPETVVYPPYDVGQDALASRFAKLKSVISIGNVFVSCRSMLA